MVPNLMERIGRKRGEMSHSRLDSEAHSQPTTPPKYIMFLLPHKLLPGYLRWRVPHPQLWRLAWKVQSSLLRKRLGLKQVMKLSRKRAATPKSSLQRLTHFNTKMGNLYKYQMVPKSLYMVKPSIQPTSKMSSESNILKVQVQLEQMLRANQIAKLLTKTPPKRRMGQKMTHD